MYAQFQTNLQQNFCPGFLFLIGHNLNRSPLEIHTRKKPIRFLQINQYGSFRLRLTSNKKYLIRVEKVMEWRPPQTGVYSSGYMCED